VSSPHDKLSGARSHSPRLSAPRPAQSPPPPPAIRRDIKPDNILLDAAGHAHFTDFNVAIHYSARRMHTSVAGSMAYMAPEVVDAPSAASSSSPSSSASSTPRKGYTWCVDWWSLGVTAYELLFHRRPFDGRTADKMKHAILRDPVRFPIVDGGAIGVARKDGPPSRVSQEGASALRQVRPPLAL
jgi:serine/threonine protein kinase